MENKKQIVFIHGGDSFSSKEEFYAALKSWEYNPYKPEKKRWRDKIETQVEAAGGEWLFVSMPNKQNAEYEAWKIWFDKVVPHLREDVILMGHSLGGGFLLRYLSEHALPVAIKQLHLVSPVVCADTLGGVNDFAIDCDAWNGFASTIDEVHLWHSEDDSIVPIHHSERLAELYPAAQLHRFTDRFHFIGEEFPELLECIQGK